MSWFWHPLISPAVGAYCLLGVAVVAALVCLFDRSNREGRQ